MAKPSKHPEDILNSSLAEIHDAKALGIQKTYLNDASLAVLKKLRRANFQAYIVGGAVRDLLLGLHPKDFDIATDATPEQVKRLFRGARIIGRRFRIVHVRFGREIIEVTTFRGHHSEESLQKKNNESASNSEGMLLRDNVFGNIEEDALRRDFTANALYYCDDRNVIYDFTKGVDDILHKQLRIIGDADTRFKEDPVRILRAIRLATKLGFSIDTATREAIKPNADMLRNIPPARLFDELLKLLCSGHGEATFSALQEYGLEQYLISNHRYFSEDKTAQNLINQALVNTDLRLRQGKSVTPAFIYAVILWPHLQHLLKQPPISQIPQPAAFHEAAQVVFQQQQSRTAIPKRIQTTIKEIWELQYRLDKRQGRRAFKLMEHPRFRAAYDFLLLREKSGEISPALGSWWTEFQEMSEQEKEQEVRKLNQGKNTNQGKGRRKPHKRPPKKSL